MLMILILILAIVIHVGIVWILCFFLNIAFNWWFVALYFSIFLILEATVLFTKE